MIELIIGQNALGKTAYLKKVVERYGIQNVNTNLNMGIWDITVEETGFNEDRLEILKELLMTDKIETGTHLNISEPYIELSFEFLKLFTILCKDRNTLVLDEPEKCLTLTERMIFVNFIHLTDKTYDNIYIVTHDESTLGLIRREVYTVRFNSNGTIDKIPVPKEKEYEIID